MNPSTKFPQSFAGGLLILAIACLVIYGEHLIRLHWPIQQQAKPAAVNDAAAQVWRLNGEPRGSFAINQPAPDFIFVGPDGQRRWLSDLRGKPVVLNFWATWCTPCKAEMPELQALYVEAGERASFELLAVNMREAVGPVADFSADLGLTFPLVIDSEGALATSYRVTVLPTTIIIDADGIVREQHLGPLDRERLRELLAVNS